MMKKMIALVVFGWGAWSLSAQSTEPRFDLTVVADTVGMNEILQVDYVLHNAEKRHLDQPNFADFEVLAGPNISTSMQMINASVTRSSTFSYVLRPLQPGLYTLPSISISTDKGIFHSNAKDIVVVEYYERPQQKMYDPWAQFDEMMKLPFFNDPFSNHPFFSDPFQDFGPFMMPSPIQPPSLPYRNQPPPADPKKPRTYRL